MRSIALPRTDRRAFAVAAGVLVSLAASAGTAAATMRDLPATLGSELAALSNKSVVDVLLPQRLPFDFDGALSATATATDNGYEITLAADPDCGGAGACTLGTLSAERGAKRSNQIRVRLVRKTNGWYRDLSCGASCAPPSLQFTRKRVLYTMQAKVFQRGKSSREILRRAANSALSEGPR